jgi:hypothetical protein
VCLRCEIGSNKCRRQAREPTLKRSRHHHLQDRALVNPRSWTTITYIMESSTASSAQEGEGSPASSEIGADRQTKMVTRPSCTDTNVFTPG